jgi:hypothetical protein
MENVALMSEVKLQPPVPKIMFVAGSSGDSESEFLESY